MRKWSRRPPSASHPRRGRSITRFDLEILEQRRLLATDITRYHVDSQSTGANLNETQLTSSNVNSADFGQLANVTLDGQVYAEPLVMTNQTIAAGPNTVGSPGVYDSVVFVATENDSLYAVNAATGAILWQRTFLDTTNPNDALAGASSVSTVSSADVSSYDINPQIGITGTPVIDPSTNIMYVCAATKEVVAGTTYFVQRLHAINLADGTDAAASFVIGTTTNGNTNNTPIDVAGTGDGSVNGVVQFNALRENDRAALSLVNGVVYAAWASHGDNGPYHGWVAAWNVSNLSTKGMVLSGVLCTDPNGGEGGIWDGGGGLTFDPSETFNGQPAFYFETGNGTPRGGNPTLDANGFPTDLDYYESLLKVITDPTSTPTSPNSNGWGLKIVDYFTPYNVNALDNADEDFGSGSPLVLPDSAGIPGHPHLMVASGKEGTIYLIDRDNLGKFTPNADNVLNSVYNPATGITTPPVLINGSLSTPAYYHGTLYWVSGYNGSAYSYVVAPNPAPSPPNVPVAVLEPTSETVNNNFGYLPGSVMVSANGGEDPADAVVWIMDLANDELHAFSALSLNQELWNSGAGSISGVKFAVPTVANGEVFVGTQSGLQIFGLTGPGAPAKAPNSPTNVSAQALSGSAVELSWTDTTVSPNFASNYVILASTDGIHFTPVANAAQESTSFTVTGLLPSTLYDFEIEGENSAGVSSPSNIASAKTTNRTGLTPSAPVGLGATPASGSEVYLTWTNTAGNETGFVLTRADDSLFTQNVVTENLASAPYYFTDAVAGLSPGHTYFYKLQATNSAGLSSDSNIAAVTIPNVPAAATNATAVLNGTAIDLSWTDHAGPFALGYQISRSIDGGPYVIYAVRPETSDSPPSIQTFTDTTISIGHTYTYEIVAENIAGFSNPAYASASYLGSALVTLDSAGNLSFMSAPGLPDRLSVRLAGGVYAITDLAAAISVTGAGSGLATLVGASTVAVPAADLSSITLDTADGADSIAIISDAVPITITADSGGGKPVITLGDPTNNELISGTITNAGDGMMTVAGAGTTTISGGLVCQATGGIDFAGPGAMTISGAIDLGLDGNIIDSSTGAVVIGGKIVGTSATGFGTFQGLAGEYFNLPAAQNLIQPADSSNPAWLGNQTPVVSAQLVGPIDFPDIANNGFADSAGNPAYYNLGAGNNNNVEARWYGEILIPGTGTTPVPVNFSTTSDDGSMLYIDGNIVVNNNNFQGANQVTGLVDLTPGLHAIDVEYYQGGGGATMDLQWDPTGGTNFVDIPNSAFTDTLGVNSLTKTGAGTLTLSNTNAYSGTTTIDAGTLIATIDGALGPASAAGVIVKAGGALALEGVNYATAEPISIAGAGPVGAGAIENLGGASVFAGPITLSNDAVIGSDAGSLALTGALSMGQGSLTLLGAGAITTSGNISDQAGNLDLAGSGGIDISGNVNLGLAGNVFDSGSGQDTISGVIGGTATSGIVRGLAGDYFNLTAAQNLIQPADSANPAWLGNQTPLVTAQLVGPIDFPDIANNGFADSTGNPAYFNLGAGNNNNIEARWHGDILIPGTGTTPVPVNFATTSDDGSMLYIDGNAVVANNNFQPANLATGLVDLTPGLHAIDVEYYQGGGGAMMDLQWDPTGGTNFVDIPNSAFVEPTNALIKSGPGALTLSNTNSYPGATMVLGGTLIVAANGAMGPASAGGVTVGSGAALAFSGGGDYTTAEPISIIGAGPSGSGAIENIGGVNALTAPITLSGAATIGSDGGSLTLAGNLAAGANPLTFSGAGALNISGAISIQNADITLANTGPVAIPGTIDLGSEGNLIDSGSGSVAITGRVSGSTQFGYALAPGLIGDYYNLPAATNLIQPDNQSNPHWLGNVTPAATSRLVGPIDFPNVASNGFSDNLGDPSYYNAGPGNANVEARWYGVIAIPGTGTAPVPINFAMTSDDGSMLAIDGNVVVANNHIQTPTQAAGLVDLTPGLHTIDVEYFYQGGGGGAMDLQWDPTGGSNFTDIPFSAFSSLMPVNTLTKTGSGTLTLAHANAYSGFTTISGGTVIVTADGALGSAYAAGIVVNPGGALGISGGFTYATAEPMTISGAGPAGAGAIENISGANAFTGSITTAGDAAIGSDAGQLTLNGNISTGADALSLVGAGAITVNGGFNTQSGSLRLANAGPVALVGNIDLGLSGNIFDTGAGSVAVQGTISGSTSSTSGYVQGLVGDYYNLPAAQDLIQPAAPGNTAWLGNQTPLVTAQLVGPIDFPDIASNGFADSAGNPAYFNLGAGNNNNIEARWYGEITIPGAGSSPVPVGFSLASGDSGLLAIDGALALTSNSASSPATAVLQLTPGRHAIELDYLHAGGASAAVDLRWDPTGGNTFVDIPNTAFAIPVNGVIKTGAGTLSIASLSTYSGPTFVGDGDLLLNGKLYDSSISVAAAGELSGDGLANVAAVQGVFAPGDSPGVMTVKNLAMTPGSTFMEQLGGVQAGAQFDQVILAPGGTIALDNATLALSSLNGFVPTVGEQFTLIADPTGAQIIGTFSQGSQISSGGLIYAINYAGGAGHDIVLTVISETQTALSITAAGSTQANPSLYGQTLSLTATVSAQASGSGIPTGVVVFEDGSTILESVPLDQGSASLTIATLGAGVHDITASFAGTADWRPSVDSLTQTVNQDPTTTTIAGPSTAQSAGQSFTLSATVSTTGPASTAPLGMVDFSIDGVQVGESALQVVNGVSTAVFADAGLAAGTHQIAAHYLGSANFASGSAMSANIVITPSSPSGGPPTSGSGSSQGTSNPPSSSAAPPQLEKILTPGGRGSHSLLILQFNEAMNAARAGDVADYEIFNSKNTHLKIRSVVYNSSTWTVALRTKKKINLRGGFELLVNGSMPDGLTNAAGVSLDGTGTGVAGTSALRPLTKFTVASPGVSSFGRPRFASPHRLFGH